MNIFQKYEKELGYPASAYVHDNSFNYESYEAIREAASLRNWLWDCYSIWVVVRHETFAFVWYIDFPIMKYSSNGKVFETPQQAYADAFETVLTANEFIQHKNFNQ